MPNSWFARVSVCSRICLSTPAFALPATTAPRTRPAVAVSAIQGEPSSEQPNALQPRTLNELFQAARDDGHVNVIVTLDLGTAFQSEGQLSAAAVDQQRALIAQTRKGLMTELAGTASTINREYKTVAAVALRVDEAGLKALKSSGRVSRISDDALSAPSLGLSTGGIGQLGRA